MLNEKEKIENRANFSRLIGPGKIQDVQECHKIITDTAFFIISNHQAYLQELDLDANRLFQMTMLKMISLDKLSRKEVYTCNINSLALKEDTYDSFGMFNLVRAQYEAFANFNNIYIQHKTQSELELKYLLWVISGLKYRQRFDTTIPETIAKKQREETQITQIQTAITQNACYLTLNSKSQARILDLIKDREWKIRIDGANVYKVAWHEMMNNAGGNNLLQMQYSALSLSTHPSNVSVFQFGKMFEENFQEDSTSMALLLSSIFMALLVRDYVVYFKLEKSIFSQLPFFHQVAINAYNKMFRGEVFAVNDINKHLN